MVGADTGKRPFSLGLRSAILAPRLFPVGRHDRIKFSAFSAVEHDTMFVEGCPL